MIQKISCSYFDIKLLTVNEVNIFSGVIKTPRGGAFVFSVFKTVDRKDHILSVRERGPFGVFFFRRLTQSMDDGGVDRRFSDDYILCSVSAFFYGYLRAAVDVDLDDAFVLSVYL